MKRTKYTAEFKEEVVKQVIDKGHTVVDIASPPALQFQACSSRARSGVEPLLQTMLMTKRLPHAVA